MTTNVNLKCPKIAVRMLLLLLIAFSTKAKAQPDYVFKNSVLVSGTDLKVGAKYKFSTVKAGVDAFVTITTITAGVTLTQLDGPSGYTETLQPTIDITAWNSGYVEVKIEFVTAGTSTLLIQPQLNVTCIDVDGIKNYDSQNHDLHEYNAVNLGGGYTDFNTLGGEVTISQSGNWFTGTNSGGIDYPGRDTAAKAVMFSVINTNVSTAYLRFGINNQTASTASRLESIYFKKFSYPNSTLALHSSTRLRPGKTAEGATGFSVLPNNIQSSAHLAINAKQDGLAMLEFVDYSGRIVLQQHLVVYKGANNIPLFELSRVAKGSYVAVLKMDGVVYNDKVVRM